MVCDWEKWIRILEEDFEFPVYIYIGVNKWNIIPEVDISFFLLWFFVIYYREEGEGEEETMNRIKLLSSCLRSFPVFVNMMERGVIKRKGHTVYMHIYIYLTLIQSINESVDENGFDIFYLFFFFVTIIG